MRTIQHSFQKRFFRRCTYWKVIYKITLKFDNLNLFVSLNHEQAFKLINKAAEQDVIPAYVPLAVMLLNGIGTEKNEKEGMKMIEKAKNRGHPVAWLMTDDDELQIGIEYHTGRGGREVDFLKGFEMDATTGTHPFDKTERGPFLSHVPRNSSSRHKLVSVSTTGAKEPFGKPTIEATFPDLAYFRPTYTTGR